LTGFSDGVTNSSQLDVTSQDKREAPKMSESKTCPKCGRRMKRKPAVYAIAQRASEDVMMEAGVRLNPERTLDVVAYHCSECGFVEFYTPDFFMLELDALDEQAQ
jgi:predicted nucleic-acid-binding Zn-ribbon protein